MSTDIIEFTEPTDTELLLECLHLLASGCHSLNNGVTITHGYHVHTRMEATLRKLRIRFPIDQHPSLLPDDRSYTEPVCQTNRLRILLDTDATDIALLEVVETCCWCLDNGTPISLGSHLDHDLRLLRDRLRTAAIDTPQPIPSISTEEPHA